MSRRRKSRTYLELAGLHGRARFIVLVVEVGGRWSFETQNFLSQLARAKAGAKPSWCNDVRSSRGVYDGVHSCHALSLRRWLPRCWNCLALEAPMVSRAPQDVERDCRFSGLARWVCFVRSLGQVQLHHCEWLSHRLAIVAFKKKAANFSFSESRCHFASILKPEEKEFVVHSGASMHMISKKDLSDVEMDTLTKSCSPTMVITANGEVQTQEEVIVYVKELEKFFTPAALSFGKLCDKNGCSYEQINGQKPHLVENGIRIICNTENFVLVVVPGLSSSASGSSSTSRTPVKQES